MRPRLLAAAGCAVMVAGAAGLLDVRDPRTETYSDPVGSTGSAVPVPGTVERLVGPAVVANPGVAAARLDTDPTVTLPAPTSSWVLPPPAPTTTVPAPVDGDCESWRSLLARYGIPYDEALPRMRRESHCTNAHNWNPSTGDDSYGPLQINLWGRHGWWSDRGFPVWFVETPEGAVAAAAFLYHACGWGPWQRPYSCWGSWPA